MSKFNSMGWKTVGGAVLAAILGAGCAQGPDAQAGPVDGVAEDGTTQFRALSSDGTAGDGAASPEVAQASGVPAEGTGEAATAGGDANVIAASTPAAPANASTAEAGSAVNATFPADASTAGAAAPAEPRAATVSKPTDVGINTDYFSSEEFSRQFATSFLRRSDVEPTLSEDEIPALQDVFELIKKEKRDRALAKLERENERYSTPTVNYLIGQFRFEKAKEALDAGDDAEANRLYDESADYYSAAIEQFPKYLNAHHYLALVHFQRERFREAAQSFSAELRLGGVDRLTYGLLGISLMNEELYLPAETAFRNALLLDPFNQDWSLGLSRCLFKQQRYGEAATLVGGMIRGAPDKPELWLLQGNAYVGLQQPERAAENFRIAQALGGATPQSLDLMADIYANKGLGDLAVDGYIAAIEASTSPSPARALRSARLMTQNGELAAAKRLLDGIESSMGGDRLADNDRDTILKLRSKIAVKEGNSEDQIQTLRQIVERNPLDGEAFILLGQAYERTKDYDEAKLAFETGAGIDGFEADALRKHGEMLVRRRMFDDAIPLLTASLQRKESNAVREYLEAVKKAAKRSSR